MPHKQPSAKFKIGDLVRVKHGVTDVDYPDIPMGGWVGRISKAEEGTYLIRWSIETLENVHPVYRKRCERDGNDIEEYWVNVEDLEPAGAEPLNMEQPTNIITRPLSADDQDDRICMAFGLTSDDPSALRQHGHGSGLFQLPEGQSGVSISGSASSTRSKDRQRAVTVTGCATTSPSTMASA